MSDVQKYINKRKRRDSWFAEGFETGYANFKIGVLLRQSRERAGTTQDQVARRLRMKTSVISRMENHAEDMPFSRIQRYAKVLGKDLRVVITD